MNCKQCNHTMEEGALFCTECGFSAPVKEQKDKVEQLKAKAGTIVMNMCHSPLFLVFTILFTAMLACYVFSAVLGGIFSIIGSILPLIFIIIATVGLWKSFGAKDKYSVSSLKSASIYDGYIGVIYTIAYILIIICCVISFIGAIIALVGVGSSSSESTGYISLGAMLVPFAIMFFVYAVVIAIFIVIRSLYKNRREYFIALVVYSNSGVYTKSKAPIAGSIIIGIVTVLGSISSLFMVSMMGLVTQELMEAMWDLGIEMEYMEEIPVLLSGFMSGASIGMLASGLSSLLLGAYYICSGIWMFSVHKKIIAAELELGQEKKALETIEKRTKSAINAHKMEIEIRLQREREEAEEAERQRKQAEEEELARKREEEAAAQRKAQEQQQLMMQMMMQQMMANSGVTPPVAPTPEQATSNDAKILELQREKEAAEEKARKAEEQQQLMMQMMQQMMEKMNSSQPAPADSDKSAK